MNGWGVGGHPYHLVQASPWPFVVASGLAQFVGGLIAVFSGCSAGLMGLGVITVVLGSSMWVRDMVCEATFLGLYVKMVRKQLRLGFFLFLTSEVMLFISCFWAFFDAGLAPTPWLGCDWPPVGVVLPYPFGLPMWGTCLLLSSGASITWAHDELARGSRKGCLGALFVTICLGLSFTWMQLEEYFMLPYSMADSACGSTFFLLTGLHGMHVIAGSVGLVLAWVRCYLGHFSPGRHLGFRAALWYWHFVDVMWIGVYFSVYLWGGWGSSW